MIKSIVKYTLISVFSILIAEGFLNLVYSPTILMSKWFTSNIHTPDSSLYYIFTPNYRGWMRHKDKTFLKRLTLDNNGFRNPAMNSAAERDIVLIGGASMIFGYGMEDSETIHYHIKNNLDLPSNVFNTAWPGTNIHRNFLVYKRKLENQINPKLIICFFYGENLKSFKEYKNISNILREEKQIQDTSSILKIKKKTIDKLFFYSRDQDFLEPQYGIAKRVGYLYYNSIIIHSLSNNLDDLYFRVSQIKKKLFEDDLTVLKIPTDQNKKVELNAGIKLSDSSFFVDYINSITSYFERKNQRVLFVFLPTHASEKRYYDEIVSLMPNSVDYIDINKELHEKIKENEFIAIGHYSKKHSEIIGKFIASKVNSITSQNCNGQVKSSFSMHSKCSRQSITP
jgi:hypothetical protein